MKYLSWRRNWLIFLVLVCIFCVVSVLLVRQINVDAKSMGKSAHEKWAEKIQRGGYILHFRHTTRNKWNDVTAFDALELVNGIDAEKSSFASATCLSEQGVEEAKMIGAVFDITGVGISDIFTSPSCRARQTSRFAFGDEGVVVNALIHRTAMPRHQHDVFAQTLRSFIDGISVPADKNVILSGHGSTLSYDNEIVVTRSDVGEIDDRREGGFVVLEKVSGDVIARHVFRSFRNYSNAAVDLPINNE